ncbi:hypothetical protein [Salinibacterium sp. SWN1162]|uniref:phage terminase small subunit n=1 Tax=Salinibacterium sp. SWN1162 TaxID=2792053 RepID=UPI0018CE1A73|nr:hypothetical protein [Salinibacterium sp. SWN1162]MBH0009986.1 hypothetical protein [Salinibacterium sp. SWN1162]
MQNGISQYFAAIQTVFTIGISMAGRGFVPSGNAKKASRNHAPAAIKSDGFLGGFSLPSAALGRDDNGPPVAWHPRTLAWWDAWRASPQGMLMLTEVDWRFLLDTALLHHHFWSCSSWQLGAELRLRVSKFGATPEDRTRLRFEVEGIEQLRSAQSTTADDGHPSEACRR